MHVHVNVRAGGNLEPLDVNQRFKVGIQLGLGVIQRGSNVRIAFPGRRPRNQVIFICWYTHYPLFKPVNKACQKTQDLIFIRSRKPLVGVL